MDIGEGLEKIGKQAFTKCASLRRIIIPPAEGWVIRPFLGVKESYSM
jgi:hypothetical protein